MRYWKPGRNSDLARAPGQRGARGPAHAARGSRSPCAPCSPTAATKTRAKFLRHTRLCHAITYASCQGLTLRGRVHLCDTSSPHFSKTLSPLALGEGPKFRIRRLASRSWPATRRRRGASPKNAGCRRRRARPSAQREPQQAGVGDRVAKLRVAEQLRSREALAVVQQEPLPTSQTSTKLPLATLVRAGWWARRRKRPATGNGLL